MTKELPIDITPFRVGTIVQIVDKAYVITSFSLNESCSHTEHTLGGEVFPRLIDVVVEISCKETTTKEMSWTLELYVVGKPLKIGEEWFRLITYCIDRASQEIDIELRRAFWIQNED